MSPDNIALTGLHAHPEFHAEVTGSGRWTGGPRSTWRRSGPTLVWKDQTRERDWKE